MALAQVVYQISTDANFAAQMRSDPKSALEERGWRLSTEELAFLLSGLFHKSQGSKAFSEVEPKRRWWG